VVKAEQKQQQQTTPEPVPTVRHVALLDSTHDLTNKRWPDALKRFLSTGCLHWVRSSLPVDSDMSFRNGTPVLSGGSTIHELVCFHAMKSVFRYFCEDRIES
jgi:hypothetical protein